MERSDGMDYRLSQRIENMTPSATLAMAEKARALGAQGVRVISFAAGEPDFDTPAHIKQAASDALERGETKYPSPVAGLNPLRDAICRYLRRHSDLEYERDQICVSAGAKNSLYLAFQVVLDPGDEVLIPVPYWVSYPDQVRLAGGEPVFVTAADGGLKPQAADIERAITDRTRALVLNSPSNPSGAVYRAQELATIAAVLRETKIVVLSDEIYHRLVFTSEPCASFATFDGMYERTLTINGCSKTYAMTGWRLGYVAGPEALVKAMARLQGQITSGPTTFVQTAAADALLGDQDCVAQMRETYRARGIRMAEALNAIAGVRCAVPEGAFYCFPDVSGTFAGLGVAGADAFAEHVLEHAHVALVSGAAFGCPNHARLSFAASDEQIEEGLARLTALLTRSA